MEVFKQILKCTAGVRYPQVPRNSQNFFKHKVVKGSSSYMQEQKDKHRFLKISTISWRPVLVMEEAGVPGENHRNGQATCKLDHLRR
jgi:hypothetical protein